MKENVLILTCQVIKGNWLRLVNQGDGTITALYYLAPDNRPQSPPKLITTTEISAQKPLVVYLSKLFNEGVSGDFAPEETSELRKPLFWCHLQMTTMYLSCPNEGDIDFAFAKSLGIVPSNEDIRRLLAFLTDAFRLSFYGLPVIQDGPVFGLG